MDVVLRQIQKSYGEKQVLNNFSFRFPAGETCCILGASGCGKTTLLRLVAGLEKPDSGTIDGISDRRIAMVFQENRLLENITAEKNILLTARRGFSRMDARNLLRALGLEGEAERCVKSLSGGMQRRVAVARALASDYDLLLLDEPLTGLDGGSRGSVLEAIARRSAGRTVLWVTHDPADALRLNARVLTLP